MSAGWGRQDPTTPGWQISSGVLIDANLAWRASAFTTFLLTARSDFVETNAARIGWRAIPCQAAIEVRHALLRYLIGTAGVRHTVTPYHGIALTERETTSELGLEYYCGRDVIVFGKLSARRVRIRPRPPATLRPTSCASA